MADCLSSKVLRRISKEVNTLRQSPPEGVRVIVNEDDITDVKAWIQGPAETPYENGFFKILVKYGPEYPSLPPHCTFATKIFHPNVGPSGEICVNTLKKDWTSTQTLLDILTVVKCLLIYPNPESALDEEAARLLLDQYDEYRTRAKLLSDIHARARPAEFQLVGSDCVPRSNRQPPSEKTADLRLAVQPLASSNQVNGPLRLVAGPGDCDDLNPSGGIVAQGENQNPPARKAKVMPTKEKERRGRRRL